MKQSLVVTLGLGVMLLFASPLTAQVIIPVAKTVSSIPLLALEGQSFAGQTVSTPLLDDHPLAMAELLSGKTQALLTGTSLAIKNSQSGGPLVHLATSVWDVAGLVSLDEHFVRLEDFAGKKLVLPLAGGPLDLQLQVLLKAKGLEGQVSLDYAEPVQAMAMLLAKKVDGACLPEPLVSRLVLLNKAHQVFRFSEAWAAVNGEDGRAPQVSLVARRDWAGAHKDFLLGLLGAYRQSLLAVQADPQKYAAKFAPVLGLPAAVVERGLRQTLFELPTRGETIKLVTSYLALVGDAKPVAADFYWGP